MKTTTSTASINSPIFAIDLGKYKRVDCASERTTASASCWVTIMTMASTDWRLRYASAARNSSWVTAPRVTRLVK